MNGLTNKILTRLRVDPVGVAMPGPKLPQRVRKIIEERSSARISRMRLVNLIAACAIMCIAFVTIKLTQGQSTPRALPKFDVVSIRPEPPSITEWNTRLVYPGGRFLARGCTVRALIIVAYGVQNWQVSGGPSWAGLNGERFHIVAMPPENSPMRDINPDNPKLPPPEEERMMLRSMLADRFHLIVNETTSEASGYALVRKGRTAKLTEAKDPKAFPVVGYGRQNDADEPNFLLGENATMLKLAQRLSELLSVPVADETGIQGSFDFKLNYLADASDPNAKGPSLPVALHELGLEIEPQKLPVRRIVVEQIEEPSPN